MSIATKNVWIDSERDRWARFTGDLPEKRESTSNACMPAGVGAYQPETLYQTPRLHL